MDVDLPEVVAEVREAFERYEKALVGNDVPTLDSLFRQDERTIRYGIAENLYGHKEVAAFRAGRHQQCRQNRKQKHSYSYKILIRHF